MRVLDWMREHLLATAICYLAVVAVTTVAAAGIGVWLLAALLTGGSTGALLDGALAVLLATVLVGTVTALLSLVGIGVGLYSRIVSAVAWLDDALVRWTDAAVRSTDRLRSTVAEAAEPTASHPGATTAATGLDRLKAEYVQGSISEHEFERRVRDALGGGGDSESVDQDPASATDGRTNEGSSLDEWRRDSSGTGPVDDVVDDWLDRSHSEGET